MHLPRQAALLVCGCQRGCAGHGTPTPTHLRAELHRSCGAAREELLGLTRGIARVQRNGLHVTTDSCPRDGQ